MPSPGSGYAFEIEAPDGLSGVGPPSWRFAFIVYLHGSGESGGVAREQVRVHGPWKHLERNVKARSALARYFVIAPHLPRAGETWDAGQLVETLGAAFAEIGRRYGRGVLDLDRAYVTGNSRGGRGALELALRGFPDPEDEPRDASRAGGRAFRAAAIICPEQGAAAGLREETSYQFFHRENDFNRPTRGTYFELRRAPNARFHVYAGFSHDCWTAPYANPALYDWLEDPSSRPDWGHACDRGMCVEEATDFIAVERSALAPFCAAHAAEFRQGTAPWVERYRSRLQAVP